MINALKNDKTLGIDIGEKYIKLIGLQKNQSDPKLLAHGIFRRENFIQFKKALLHPVFKKAKIRVNLNDPELVVQRVEIQAEDKVNFKQAINERLVNLLRNPIDEYDLIYQCLDPSEAKTKYIAYALPKRHLKDFKQFIKQLGIKKFQVLEPELSAMYLAYVRSYGNDLRQPTPIINFGENKTTFSVFSSSGVLFYMHLDQVSGNDLTHHLSQVIGIDYEQAYRDKILFNEQYFSDPAIEIKFKQSIENYLNLAAEEINRALDSYQLEEPNLEIKEILLTGGASKLSGLTNGLETRLDMPVKYFEVFKNINCINFGSAEALKDDQSFYAVSLGLAL